MLQYDFTHLSVYMIRVFMRHLNKTEKIILIKNSVSDLY
jgi:hypothetical protein